MTDTTTRVTTSPWSPSSACLTPDPEHQGNDITLEHFFRSAPEPGRPVPLSVSFLEQHWEQTGRGGVVGREQLMMALADLEYILIKAAPDSRAEQSA